MGLDFLTESLRRLSAFYGHTEHDAAPTTCENVLTVPTLPVIELTASLVAGACEVTPAEMQPSLVSLSLMQHLGAQAHAGSRFLTESECSFG